MESEFLFVGEYKGHEYQISICRSDKQPCSAHQTQTIQRLKDMLRFRDAGRDSHFQ